MFLRIARSFGLVKRLIDEFKIRAQVAGIEASPKPPMQKVRLILRLARRIRAAARSLGALSQRSFRDGDTLRAARMREGAQRLIDTHAEVRAQAGVVLAESPHSEFAPTENGPPELSIKARATVL